jgi:cytochrome c oxidase assembly protein subunit 11
MQDTSDKIDAQTTDADKTDARKRKRMALALGGVAVFMTGMAFAAVPLYGLICKVTGMGGTTQRVNKAADKIVDRIVTVHFDANISPKLKWKFAPASREVNLKLGENKLVFYTVTSRAEEQTTGTATFNVTPELAGRFFDKIECFCFKEQTLKPGESAELPVSFYVDPAILDDPDAQHINEITLSYTFFPSAAAARSPVKSSAAEPAATAPSAQPKPLGGIPAGGSTKVE